MNLQRYWWDESGMQLCQPGDKPRATDYILVSDHDEQIAEKNQSIARISEQHAGLDKMVDGLLESIEEHESCEVALRAEIEMLKKEIQNVKIAYLGWDKLIDFPLEQKNVVLEQPQKSNTISTRKTENSPEE